MRGIPRADFTGGRPGTGAAVALFGVFVLLGVAGWARAAELEYSAKRYTTDDGLPQTKVSCMAQTPDGYLWCGTWFGLARFDGVRFVVFERGYAQAASRSASKDRWVALKRNLWTPTVASHSRRMNPAKP
ncbi:MAG: hypothetical protein KIT22_01370 [Verrucomicrobiae bacterium]|nr:hypothetical protein [Verrucomicrobiae bacterium]